MRQGYWMVCFSTCLLFCLLTLPLAADALEGADKEADVSPKAKNSSDEYGQRKVVPVGGSRACLRETGSQISRRHSARCAPLPGRSYSREEIDRTGQTDAAHALQRLDPSIQIR